MKIALLVLLAGCANGNPGTVVTTCNDGVASSVELTEMKSCQQVYYDEQMVVVVAKAQLGIDLTETLASLRDVTQMPEDWWWFDGKPISGLCSWNTDQVDYVKVDAKFRLLLHEALHSWEHHHGVPNTSDHPDWDKKGYYKASDLYKKFAEDADSVSWP